VDDFDLIKSYLKGNLSSFDKLLKRYEGMLYNYIYHNVNSKEEAEDLYQDIYYRVIKYLKSFKMESSYKTWLFTIARNAVIDNFRKRNIKVLSMDNTINDDENKSFHDILTSEENTPSKTLSDSENEKQVTFLLNKLDSSLKEICTLRFYSDMKFCDIANILNTNENTIKTKFKRAMDILKENYEV